MALKKYFKFGFIFLLTILIIGSSNKTVHAKKKKSEKKDINKSFLLKEPHSAHKATIYSLVLPGLGQAYNRKYWKIPVIYAGFGAMIYFIADNRSEYKKFSAAYDYIEEYGNTTSDDGTTTPPDDGTTLPDEDIPEPPNEYAELYSSTQLKSARDLYRRNLDFSYILTGLWYLLNVVDASVDAHLFEFEVNDNLTLRVEPDIKILPQEYKPYTGIKVSFSLPFSKH